MHLLIEEINHLLLGEPEWNISNVDPPGLSGDGASYHRHCGLGRVGHERGGYLAGLLHALVLHRGDVLEPRRWDIPVQRRLASLGRFLTVSTVTRSRPAQQNEN